MRTQFRRLMVWGFFATLMCGCGTDGTVNDVNPIFSNLSVTSLAITPVNTTLSTVANPQAFNVTATLNNGSVQNANGFVTWTSSNTSVASINSTSGVATPVGNGNTVITASFSGVQASTNLTVAAGVGTLTNISVTPTGNTLTTLGATQAFTAIGNFTLGGNQTVTNSVTWTSSNTSVATVNQTTGVATSVGNGNTTISANSSGVTGNATLTVNSIAAVAANLTGATLFRGNATGDNQGATGVINFGAWTSLLQVQNIPGNFAAQLFLSRTANPTAANYLSPVAAGALAENLVSGNNTFFFFGDGDDMRGGNATFGLNLFLNSAGSTPSISAFTVPGTQTFSADSAATTSDLNLQIKPGSGALSFTSGNRTITLTDFRVQGVGGTNSNVDLINSSNSIPFVAPPMPNGVFDTFGTFTLTVTP